MKVCWAQYWFKCNVKRANMSLRLRRQYEGNIWAGWWAMIYPSIHLYIHLSLHPSLKSANLYIYPIYIPGKILFVIGCYSPWVWLMWKSKTKQNSIQTMLMWKKMENVRSYSWAQAEIFIKPPQWCKEMNEGSGQMRCGWYVHVPPPDFCQCKSHPQVMRLCNAAQNSGWEDRREAAHDCTMVEIMQVSLLKDQGWSRPSVETEVK